MYRLEREEFLQSSFITLWATLGFQAGFLNSFGFLSSGRYVSHVTGFGTQIGLALGSGKVIFAIEMLAIPIMFILGAFCSGLLTSARLEKGLRPRYDVVTMFLPICILIVATLGHFGYFGKFGEDLIMAWDFILLFTLSFACGVQNGCFATMTKGQIRTTHLTGISTDIGTDLARTLFGNPTPKEAKMIHLTNVTRIATFCFFALGSIASVLLTAELEFLALLIPFSTSFAVFLAVRKVSKYLDQVWGKKPSTTVLAEAANLPITR